MTPTPPRPHPDPPEVTRHKLARAEERVTRYRIVLRALQESERATGHIEEAFAEVYGVTVKLARAATTATDIDDLAMTLRGELRAIEIDLDAKLPRTREALRNLRGRLIVALETERVNIYRYRRRLNRGAGEG